jgi:hypothetical protein
MLRGTFTIGACVPTQNLHLDWLPSIHKRFPTIAPIMSRLQFSAAPQLDSVTFLLPTDTALEAFAARFNGSTLQAVLASPHALQALASYHVLEDRVTTGQLYEGQRLQTLARDAQGKPLPLTVHRGGPGDASITFRGAGSTAGLLVPDVPVCGGIIQVIDQVLLPVEVPAAAASSPDGAPPSSSGTAAAAAG